MVGTFTQPDFETDGGTEYKTNIDNAISVISEWGASFAPHEQSTPNMTVRLDAGTIFDGTDLIVLAALDTGTITAPATNPRKDIVYIDPTGGGGSPLVYIGVQTGSESATPADPTLAAGLIPVARINLTTSTTAIANANIDDLRGVIWDQTGGSGDVSGPGSSTDDGLATFNGTGGKTLQSQSGWTLNDSNVLNGADNTLQRPKLLDYGETVNAIGAIGGGTQDIDHEAGNVITATVDTSETTFTFSKAPPSGIAGSLTLILTNGGSQTVNWPAGAMDSPVTTHVYWPGGTPPTLTSSGRDVLTFVTVDGGLTYDGFLAGADMS